MKLNYQENYTLTIIDAIKLEISHAVTSIPLNSVFFVFAHFFFHGKMSIKSFYTMQSAYQFDVKAAAPFTNF